MRIILGVGIYEGDKTFTVDINGNTCGLNVELNARYYRGDEHYYGYKLTAFSSGNVSLVGISYLSFTLRAGTVGKEVVDTSYNPPIVSLSSVERTTNLYKNDNFTLIGYTNIIFAVNDINETQTIPFNIGFIITYDGGEILYFWENLVIWLEFIYLGFTAIPATLLYRTIKRIKFEKWYVQEIKDRDENFFNILEKKKKYKDED